MDLPSSYLIFQFKNTCIALSELLTLTLIKNNFIKWNTVLMQFILSLVISKVTQISSLLFSPLPIQEIFSYIVIQLNYLITVCNLSWDPPISQRFFFLIYTHQVHSLCCQFYGFEQKHNINISSITISDSIVSTQSYFQSFQKIFSKCLSGLLKSFLITLNFLFFER